MTAYSDTKNEFNPKVSIITPSYNQGKFIKRTIESVLSQSYSNIEYIVMDGGSTDETVNILKSYGEKIIWVSEKDNGQTDAINKGIKVSTGDIIAYLNSDDVYLPNTISKIVNEFNEYKDVDFLYGDFWGIDKNDKILSKVKTIPFDNNILIYDANFICQPASFYRKRLFDTIGIFDDSLHFLMDYEFFLRAAKRRCKIQLYPDYLSAIRFHDDCKTLSDGVHPWEKEKVKIKQAYIRKKANHPSALKILSLIYRFKRYFLLLLRGRLDVANLKLAYKLRKI
ncbi:Glycosyl transferase, family 2 [hydrothermal vent metagenome]|uniref:Glycosyl transferase, family 2 n=1 Tax=hydrothermal vent metagenome TaxID=652676 RepID=A0A3B0X5T0_9ZZZZ